AVGVVVTARVLMEALMVGPVGGGDVGTGGALLAVPFGVPDLVGLGVAAAVLVDQIGDAGVRAAVDARRVAMGVQLGRPRAQEGQHRRGVGLVAAVALHVVVDRIAWR